MDNFHDLVLKTRSYRRFNTKEGISEDDLKSFVDLARNSASGANVQPLKYIISAESAKNEKIFHTLKWAGYLPDWDGPREDERPAAYIILLGDSSIKSGFGHDPGIAAQTIMLGAVEQGYGGCIFGSIDRGKLKQNLGIPDQYEILLVLALGKPVEQVVLETCGPDGDIKYYRDADSFHHVPKRRLQDIILDI
jgi:nitroreductase